MTDYKKYDSDDKYLIHNARLAKDPKVFENDNGKLVLLTFVSSSRREEHEEIWITAKVGGRNAELASFLAAKDVLSIEGKPVLKRWGEDGDKLSYELEFADIHVSIDLFMELKERGFTPGAKGESGKGGAKGGGKKAPAGAKGPKKGTRVVVDPEDDEV